MCESTVSVNGRTVVHATSGGKVIGVDPCLVPTAVGPVPAPFTNLAESKSTANGTVTVLANGQSVMIKGSDFSESTGDEPGSAGGVASGMIKGKAQFVSYSDDVKFEGKNVARQADLMVQNIGGAPNTPPSPEIQPPASGSSWEIDPWEDERIAGIELISVRFVR